MSQRFCTNCGSTREADHKFCTNCGSPFPDVSDLDVSAGAPAAETPELPAGQEGELPTAIVPAPLDQTPGTEPEVLAPIVPSVATANEAPLAGGHDLAASTPPKSRTGMWVAVAVAAALMLVGVVVLATSRGTDQPTVSASPSSREFGQGAIVTPPASTTPSAQTTPPSDAAGVSEYADVTSEKPPVASVVSFDPCDGEPFPFNDALSVSSQPPAPGSDVETAVSNVQRILNSLGYTGKSNTNTIKVDGWYGTHTEYAVRNFQRDMGIDPVGTVYTQTWAELGQQC